MWQEFESKFERLLSGVKSGLDQLEQQASLTYRSEMMSQIQFQRQQTQELTTATSELARRSRVNLVSSELDPWR